jgi:EAL domain-containing protein (putative c-di-GMP-specific phosphodiesterase class I)
VIHDAGARYVDETVASRAIRARATLGPAASGFDTELALAIDNGHLGVAYQPIVDLRSGRVRKFEALCRWNDPLRGTIPPSAFVAMAEHTGAIADVGKFVLATSCADLAGAGLDPSIGVSINVSIVETRRPDFVDEVCRTVDESGLSRSRVCIEVTESLLADDTTSVPQLVQLRQAGFQLAIDDFGTGFSSLHYISVLPVDAVKVDRRFVRKIDRDDRNAAIFRSVVDLSRGLGIEVVAEGVETPAEADRLAALRCHQGQGFLYGRPMPIADAVRLVEGPRIRRARDHAPRPDAPTPVREAERLAAVHATRAIDGPPDDALDGIVALMANLLHVPIALVTLVDERRQWFAARHGLDTTETPRGLGFCAHAIGDPDNVLVVPDALDDDRFATNPLVTGDPNIRFYAGAPLRTADGLALGTLCAIDTAPRELTADDAETLRSLAALATELLFRRHHAT